MAEFVSLAEATKIAGSETDVAVANEFPKQSEVLARIPVHPVAVDAGSSAFVYQFNQSATNPTAAFRALGSEYTKVASEVTQKTVTCKVLGHSYGIDRTLVGAARGALVEYQTAQAIRGITAKFNDAFINGDSGTTAAEFDGLAVAVDGTANDVDGSAWDWSAITDVAEARLALAALMEVVELVDGQDGAVILTNRAMKAKLAALGMVAGYMTASEDAAGRRVTTLNGVPVIDLGAKAGSANPVIATTSGATDIYVARLAEDGVHLASPAHLPAVSVYVPEAGVKAAAEGSVELVTAVAVRSKLAVARVTGVTIA